MQHDPETAAKLGMAFVVMMGVALLVIGIAIHVVVCIIVSGCYKRIPQQFRQMEPGMVYRTGDGLYYGRSRSGFSLFCVPSGRRGFQLLSHLWNV